MNANNLSNSPGNRGPEQKTPRPRARHLQSVVGSQSPRLRSQTGEVSPRIVVKFRVGCYQRYEDGIESTWLDSKIGDWAKLKAIGEATKALTFKRLFTSLDEAKLIALVETACAGDNAKRRDFVSYFVLHCSNDAPVDDILAQLRGWPGVELAYKAPRKVMTPAEGRASTFATPLNVNQAYLNSALNGGAVDALFAATQPGGDGADQTVIDLEGGWTTQHIDLQPLHISPLLTATTVIDPAGVGPAFWRFHGTSVLGIICGGGPEGGPNGFRGIAPGPGAIRVVSHDADPGTIADRITLADHYAQPGDILVLEANIDGSLPCEADDAIFIAISTAVANGRVVIEAAGNGFVDLDAQRDERGNAIFDRRFRDSGAILVGASTSASPFMRWTNAPGSGSNVGDRIDCYAWGEHVFATTSNDKSAVDRYTDSFGGTSAATAIVAGVARCVQGMSEKRFGRRYLPGQLRRILANPAYGTANGPAVNPGSERIGVMPDLRSIVTLAFVNDPPAGGPIV